MQISIQICTVYDIGTISASKFQGEFITTLVLHGSQPTQCTSKQYRFIATHTVDKLDRDIRVMHRIHQS